MFLSAPTVAMTDGTWHVFPPEAEQPPSEPFTELFLSEKLPSLQHAFEPGRCKGTLAALYETMIVHQLQRSDLFCNNDSVVVVCSDQMVHRSLESSTQDGCLNWRQVAAVQQYADMYGWMVSMLNTEYQELLCRHELEHRDSTLAACIIEPILQGANGMRMIDPLYQRVLVEACRYATPTYHDSAVAMTSACLLKASVANWTNTSINITRKFKSPQVLCRILSWPCRAKGMLVISDEIFAGLWRLGSASAWERLHIMPDIACYAKLLTGMAPLLT